MFKFFGTLLVAFGFFLLGDTRSAIAVLTTSAV